SLWASFDLSDACGAQRTQQDLISPQGEHISRIQYLQAPTGVGTSVRAFALCRTETIHREEWEGAAQPRISEDRMQFDDYGNVRDLIQTGDANYEREVEAKFNFNVATFIVDRLAFQKIYALEPSVGAPFRHQLMWTEYEYDYSGDYTHAPGSRGDL